jgi:hypothetical protein
MTTPAPAHQESAVKKSIKEKITHLSHMIFRLVTDEQYLHQMTLGKLSRSLINLIRVSITAGKKFFDDDCFTMASSIAYTTLVSLIPTLTVALTLFSVFSGVGNLKDEIFKQLTHFMAEHNLQQLNIDPMLNAISSLIENAASIGGIGAVVMVFSATAVLRTLEKSLNSIWKVTCQRSIILKIVYYWAALSLGPLMLIAGTTVATQISNKMSAPHINSYTITPDKTSGWWVARVKSAEKHKTATVMPTFPRTISISTTRRFTMPIIRATGSCLPKSFLNRRSA